ncbi:MAG: alpha/beta fold hydrolase [Thermodesulfobacteriota bacterium]
MKEEKVFFNSGGIKLEGILTLTKTHNPSPAVVVCHPHPQYGGNMHNNVVTGITDTLSEQGFITLRFNFRGVGNSEGTYGGGVEEVKDVEGAIDFLSEGVQNFEPLSETNGIFLVGYSFGAMVGLQVADKDDRIRAWVGISPPVAMYDFSLLKGSFKPKLLLFGDSDFACPKKEMEKLFDSLQEPKSMSVIPGADHFYWGKERTVAEHVLNFLGTSFLK